MYFHGVEFGFVPKKEWGSWGVVYSNLKLDWLIDGIRLGM